MQFYNTEKMREGEREGERGGETKVREELRKIKRLLGQGYFWN